MAARVQSQKKSMVVTLKELGGKKLIGGKPPVAK
jgi:hypothetical protein